MKKYNKSPLAAAMGTLVISSFAANVNAESNPFALTELSSGYMQTAAAADASNNKVTQGGCASNTGSAANAKPAAPAAKKTEGSCGEGKCGSMMTGGKMNKGMENACGAMMKNKEGACGMMDMKHGEADKNSKTAEHSCGANMMNMNSGKSGEASCGAMMKGGDGHGSTKVDADKAAGK